MTRSNSKKRILITAAMILTTSVPIRQAFAGFHLRSDLRPLKRDTASSTTRTMERRASDRADVSTMTWSEARLNLKLSSPDEISLAVKRRIKYTRDISKEDEWRSGKDTWERQEGDCEDYAAAVKELCADNGTKAEIMVLHSITDRQTHAVTIGERNGQIWVSSNGSYREFSSMYDAKQAIARDQGWTSNKVLLEKESDVRKNTSNKASDAAAATETR